MSLILRLSLRNEPFEGAGIRVTDYALRSNNPAWHALQFTNYHSLQTTVIWQYVHSLSPKTQDSDKSIGHAVCIVIVLTVLSTEQLQQDKCQICHMWLLHVMYTLVSTSARHSFLNLSNNPCFFSRSTMSLVILGSLVDGVGAVEAIVDAVFL